MARRGRPLATSASGRERSVRSSAASGVSGLKREFLKETMTEFRASARDGLKERYPELQARGKMPPIPEGYKLPQLPPALLLAK